MGPGVVLTIPTAAAVDPYGGYTPSPGVPAPYVPPVVDPYAGYTPSPSVPAPYVPPPPPVDPYGGYTPSPGVPKTYPGPPPPVPQPLTPTMPTMPPRAGATAQFQQPVGAKQYYPTAPIAQPQRLLPTTFPTSSPYGRPLSDYLVQQAPPDWRIQPTTPTGRRIQSFINTLFGIKPPRLQTPYPAGPASTLGNVPALGGYSTGTALGPSPLQPMIQGEATRAPILRALIERGMSPSEAAIAIERGIANVPSGTFAPPTVGELGVGGWPDLVPQRSF